jgi:hypothetical protein
MVSRQAIAAVPGLTKGSSFLISKWWSWTEDDTKKLVRVAAFVVVVFVGVAVDFFLTSDSATGVNKPVRCCLFFDVGFFVVKACDPAATSRHSSRVVKPFIFARPETAVGRLVCLGMVLRVGVRVCFRLPQTGGLVVGTVLRSHLLNPNHA